MCQFTCCDLVIITQLNHLKLCGIVNLPIVVFLTLISAGTPPEVALVIWEE